MDLEKKIRKFGCQHSVLTFEAKGYIILCKNCGMKWACNGCKNLGKFCMNHGSMTTDKDIRIDPSATITATENPPSQ